jgi:hypothetical protein
MVVEDSDPADQPAGNQLRKGKNGDNEQIKKKPVLVSQNLKIFPRK